ncbi:MAG: type I restriction enzyme HsdR N-terminal domain-containing protein [Flavobacteriales bacterium]
MQSLNFPTYSIRLRQQGQITLLWDVVRKKWLARTPEEWVRQHLIHYLHREKSVPLGMMSVEKKIELNGMARRPDLVVYKGQQAVMICECKAPEVPLTQLAMDQAARYNMALRVPVLLITNGMVHFCAQLQLNEGNAEMLIKIPDYADF